MNIRKARACEIDAVAAIYEAIHSAEEAGTMEIGWARDVYPTRATAQAAFDRDDLFVELDAAGRIVGAAILNRIQVDSYAGAPWRHPADDADVLVMHTLVISPEENGRGYGRAFLAFYEGYAAGQGCRFLRIDTNERNRKARLLYRKLGYEEIAVVPTTFNGIRGVNLVLLEKAL